MLRNNLYAPLNRLVWCNTLGIQPMRNLKYNAADVLPIPDNIDASETIRFSPHRSRDISANLMSTSTYNNNTESSLLKRSYENTMVNSTITDPHIESYDQCFGAVRLNSALQSSVPIPLKGMQKLSHLNMPGGQWSQEGKFMSQQQLQHAHYTVQRQHNANERTIASDLNATLNRHRRDVADDYYRFAKTTNRYASLFRELRKCENHLINIGPYSSYSTKPVPKTTVESEQLTDNNSIDSISHPHPAPAEKSLTKKEALKRAFAEYGTTIIAFHITISLVSLGLFYLLVSGGIDMMTVLEYIGLKSDMINNKVAAGASTFVVAYAIHKIFAPARIGITLGVAPFLVRFLRKKGIIKSKPIKK